ncbi:TIGR04197 family type VII secretion effector [Listeria swaminathanii]|uniref:TIGR04197 family type VII secretion effector n=1 Tax=Listeria swaminathanii TaxID=2713501 RepID=A0ABU2ICX8_9LIST|nr:MULTISPECIES: TIGR04197 family type VII secretion effector [Listeria]MBC2121670.1 TIGR04197 family type VII secretion effector [Listeria marthii]MDT0016169.1 TIGR04197 family type VII secretion effector [Listeria swaminathanii]MDT0021605.1 TIGR04197 family type VII secretion effector [Listeria swaminathanii]MDT0032569.1 TIGR04197 family type VII secretion effector [Listeria swaminathanii]MDT0051581.1 TIGR04197 family type VII secretion effector [Listeria swaminathanii]
MMEEINSNKELVIDYTNALFTSQELFLQKNATATISIETNLTANQHMKDVYSDSLTHTDNYCTYLSYDIQNVLKIAGLFEEIDEQMKNQFEDIQ